VPIFDATPVVNQRVSETDQAMKSLERLRTGVKSRSRRFNQPWKDQPQHLLRFFDLNLPQTIVSNPERSPKIRNLKWEDS